MKNKITYIPIGILTLTTALSGVALSSAGVAAETSGSKTAAVSVDKVCSFTTDSSYTTNIAVPSGTSTNTESLTRATNQITCNSTEGFKVQAVGFSPDATHAEGLAGNTAMYSTVGTIPTGTSGSSSYWAFKVRSVSGNTSATVAPGYLSYSVIPDTATNIVSYSSSVSAVVTGSFRTDYQIYAAVTQPVGTYNGAVKYTISLDA